MTRTWPTSLVAALVLCGAAPSASAVTVQTWVREGETLRAGAVDGAVITPDGLLAPGPKQQALARPATAVLWSVLVQDGEVIAGAGENLGLLRVSPAGAASIPGVKGGPDIFAAVRGPAGQVFAATSPSGAVFRVDLKKGQAQEIFKPQATYIWALLALPDGGLVVATGLPGRVFRLDSKGGAPTQIWETASDHVRALALGRDGKILAGTAGPGRLVELDGKGGAFVLWDALRPETTAIALDAKGTVWAAFAGAPAKAEAPAAAPGKPREGGSISVTVRAGAAEGAEAPQQKREEEAAAPKPGELPGGGGTLVRLGVGEEPETVWSDEKETPLALAPVGDGGVLLGTANAAHIWWFDGLGRLGLFDERKENRAVSALTVDGGRIVAALSNPAGVMVYGPGAAAPARWTSDVQDAKVRSTLGRIQAITDARRAGGVRVDVRVGNTAEPGPGWTSWTLAPGAAGPPDREGGLLAGLPQARFFQVRVEMTADQPYAYGVARIALHHRPNNRAPRIENVEVLPTGVALRSIPPAPMSSGEIPVVEPPRTPDLERALGEVIPPWRSKRAYEATALTVTWEGRDPDGDRLLYKVEYCRDDGGVCTNWTLLADKLDQNFFSFDSRMLPDGVHRFRVTADDSSSNVMGEGRTAVRESDPVAVDNTPPVIDRAEVTKRADGTVELRVTAHDPGGRLAKAEVARESGTFDALAPTEGLGDGERQTWAAVLPALEKGQEWLVRVTDAAGNSVTARPEQK